MGGSGFGGFRNQPSNGLKLMEAMGGKMRAFGGFEGLVFDEGWKWSQGFDF